jgi:hypothetical protein
MVFRKFPLLSFTALIGGALLPTEASPVVSAFTADAGVGARIPLASSFEVGAEVFGGYYLAMLNDGFDLFAGGRALWGVAIQTSYTGWRPFGLRVRIAYDNYVGLLHALEVSLSFSYRLGGGA